MTATVVYVRGVGELLNNSAAIHLLASAGIEFFDVDYPASFGGVNGPQDYDDSQRIGRERTIELLRRLGRPVALWGYSSGADVAGDVAAEVAAGKHPDIRLSMVGLLSDPQRAAFQLIGPNRGGYGILGERFIPDHAFPVYSFSAPGDPISELPKGNPLRMFADIAELYSADRDEFVAKVLDKAKRRQLQRWWDLDNWATWGGAVHWALNYLQPPLGRGRHTCYFTERMPGSTLTYAQTLLELTTKRLAAVG